MPRAGLLLRFADAATPEAIFDGRVDAAWTNDLRAMREEDLAAAAKPWHDENRSA